MALLLSGRIKTEPSTLFYVVKFAGFFLRHFSVFFLKLLVVFPMGEQANSTNLTEKWTAAAAVETCLFSAFYYVRFSVLY